MKGVWVFGKLALNQYLQVGLSALAEALVNELAGCVDVSYDVAPATTTLNMDDGSAFSD